MRPKCLDERRLLPASTARRRCYKALNYDAKASLKDADFEKALAAHSQCAPSHAGSLAPSNTDANSGGGVDGVHVQTVNYTVTFSVSIQCENGVNTGCEHGAKRYRS